MIDPSNFLKFLKSKKINFFTGVPDSLLKSFCAVVSEKSRGSEHIIAANEGNAIALAAGQQLASGAIPVVYLQKLNLFYYNH